MFNISESSSREALAIALEGGAPKEIVHVMITATVMYINNIVCVSCLINSEILTDFNLT